MSFAGPRPEIPYYAENYNLNEQIVFQVKPSYRLGYFRAN